MSVISLKNLGVTLADPLFGGLDLTIHPGDRIGLVAANGRGKSTLLRCLAGSDEPTFGEVTRARGLIIGHVAQDPPSGVLGLTLTEAVRTALPPDQAENERWRVDIVLDELEVPAVLREVSVASLSGGWQRVAMLARAWILGPDILLLDEPTNHLDLQRIGRLQEWIASLPRDFPMVIASHDRAFLDEVTTRTLFLRTENSQVFPLPYARARSALDDADAAAERRFSNEMQKVGQLRRQAAKLKNIGINSGSDLLVTKTKQLSERAERIEAAARPAHRDGSAGAIRLAGTGTHARALVTLEDAGVSTPDGRLLFRTGQKWIGPGDRIVVLGLNGTGKTRLLNAVLQATTSGGGDGIKVSPSARLGHSDQGLTQLDDAQTPLEAITGRFDIGDQAARTLLAGAGINIDRQRAPTRVLSGGQRARLAMLVLRLSRPNFYLLDEPTNHLDIEGQEALERELLADEASCLLVSHDRAFVRAVGNRFWLIDGKRLVEADDPEAFFSDALAGDAGQV
jgi:ATPase subunit of ABC transporter with duplicated ATPase domains